MNTIMITGASSGYGLETARQFHEKGWTVIATMRNPHEDVLPKSDRLIILPLDVTDETSISTCLKAAGPIDVLVNNAGIGMAGAFEATPLENIRDLFETNTFGTMAMIQATLPGLRARGGGTIVNVTSSTVLAPHPYVARLYGEQDPPSRAFRMFWRSNSRPFGIRVRLIEPGHAPTTRFAENVGVPVMDLIPEAYAPHAQKAFAATAAPGPKTRETDVAEAIWQAVNDTSDRLRFPAGADAVALWDARH